MTLITSIVSAFNEPLSDKPTKILDLLQRSYTIQNVSTYGDHQLIVVFSCSIDLSPFTTELLEKYGLYVHCVQTWNTNETRVWFREVGVSY